MQSYDSASQVPIYEAEGWTYFTYEVKDSCVAEDSFAVADLEVTYKYYYSRHWESVTGDNFRNMMTTDDISNLV